MATPLDMVANDDPRRLREMLEKVEELAASHSLTSVVVGLAGSEGDLLFPEIVSFIESALRVDDSIVRMTRERSVLFLTDVDRDRAQEIVERLLLGFRDRFPTAREPAVEIGYFEVKPGEHATLKTVLPTLFGVAPSDESTH